MMTDRTPLSRYSLLLLICGLFAATHTLGCRAPEEQRLGAEGEFCSRDADCRLDKGFLCENNECIDPATAAGRASCSDICARFRDECGRQEENCVESCAETVRGWSEQALEIFGECSIGNTEPMLSCEQVREDADQAATFCYQQIPLPEERQARCDTFVDLAREAGRDNSDNLTALRTNCYIQARTRPTSQWVNTDSCTAPDLTNIELVECLNMTFTPENADPIFP